MAEDAYLGHIHLHVASLEDARDFYHARLGLDVMGRFPGAAVFMAAGGYHHHVACNIWNQGLVKRREGEAGLDCFEWVLPEAASRDAALSRLSGAGFGSEAVSGGILVRDSGGHGVLLKTA